MSDPFVELHLPLVKKIAERIHASIHGAVELDELVSMGVLGLLDAASRVDPRAEGFLAYASIRVRGQILDSLGNTARLPRKAHRLVRAGRLRAYPITTDPKKLEWIPAPLTCPGRRLDRDRLVCAMLALPGRLAPLLHALYFHDRTLSEVAGYLELSISRVSRLRDRGLAELRARLTRGSGTAIER